MKDFTPNSKKATMDARSASHIAEACLQFPGTSLHDTAIKKGMKTIGVAPPTVRVPRATTTELESASSSLPRLARPTTAHPAWLRRPRATSADTSPEAHARQPLVPTAPPQTRPTAASPRVSSPGRSRSSGGPADLGGSHTRSPRTRMNRTLLASQRQPPPPIDSIALPHSAQVGLVSYKKNDNDCTDDHGATPRWFFDELNLDGLIVLVGGKVQGMDKEPDRSSSRSGGSPCHYIFGVYYHCFCGFHRETPFRTCLFFIARIFQTKS